MEIAARVASPEELPRCLAIRREVFIEEQAVPEDEEVDGRDGEALHFLAFAGGEPVGTARLRITADGHAKAERVAVRAPWRGRGAGHAVMSALEAEALRRGHREVLLSAQVQVIPFYEARGYAAYGPEFMDAGIPHRRMKKGA